MKGEDPGSAAPRAACATADTPPPAWSGLLPPLGPPPPLRSLSPPSLRGAASSLHARSSPTATAAVAAAPSALPVLACYGPECTTAELDRSAGGRRPTTTVCDRGTWWVGSRHACGRGAGGARGRKAASGEDFWETFSRLGPPPANCGMCSCALAWSAGVGAAWEVRNSSWRQCRRLLGTWM